MVDGVFCWCGTPYKKAEKAVVMNAKIEEILPRSFKEEADN
jgi:hypothetical protein